jgi:hypothetical protein
LRTLVSLVILAACLTAQDIPVPPGGPTQLIVTYRCPPPRRAAFRQYMVEYGVQRFDRWKQEGILKDYKFLFNWYIDVDTWDAMAILSFPDYNAIQRWKDIEKTSPGGLPRDALEMAWPLNSYSADLVARESANPAPDLTHAVYYVVAYDAAAPITQAKAAFRDGVLGSYSAFTNRYPGGKRWQGLLVLEYKDVESFGKRGQSKASGEREPVIAESIGH